MTSLRAVAADGAMLADALRAEDLADAATLARAARVSEETGERLDRVLTRLGMVGERDMAAALARIAGLPCAAPETLAGAPDLLEQLGARFAASARALPIEDDGAAVRLAVADPFDAALGDLAAMKLGRPVSLCVAAPADIDAALERLAGAGRGAIDALAEAAGAPDEDSAEDVARLKDIASEAPVIRMVNLIIRRAAELGASDVHLEPFERRLRLRYRVDGQLREAEAPPASLRAAVVSRIKIMARLDIAENRLPQDGRLQLTVLGRELDVRVATTPTLHGEGVVMRLLDRSGKAPALDSLGFDAAAVGALEALIARPNGVILVTGPTGSGKTTTLYAALGRLNTPERKIVTVEDPVEYQIDGVNQIQARPRIGLGFAEALRAILRQDPDVIMIGEIRDAETARIAVQAALTGHLVLATLHANSAAAAVTRLRDMGVPEYLIAATLVGAVAQRLVRRLCPDCARPEEPALAARLDPGGAGHLAPGGCAACGGAGYRGRAAMLEVLAVGEGARRLILDGADAATLEAEAVSRGMRTLRGHGLALAREGRTSLAEVARAASDDAAAPAMAAPSAAAAGA
ncbi:GspE/PulE family protein [Rubrimonas cliftonensis]|uniref:Type II secretion system protein E (GspE) n=1 Tax=Rubrimonas cliftonensis TaxID=89524 RepID=A0A1H3WRW7_9RHOB|nr:GspE/PulE family protein [Rubrimonas cliftonensis]SDZ89122.1 type II secretion system protein E (GspE) [Rubrimonas cliftonensis]